MRFFLVQVEGPFFGLVGVGDQTGEDVDQEVDRAAMAGVFDLRDVLELVNHGRDQRAFAEHEFVPQRQPLFPHIFAKAGDQTQALLHQVGGELSRNVALIAEEFAEQTSAHTADRRAIIDIARRDADSQEFAAIVDHQMQFKAEEPADGGLPDACLIGENSIASDSFVATYRQLGGTIEEDNDQSERAFHLRQLRTSHLPGLCVMQTLVGLCCNLIPWETADLQLPDQKPTRVKPPNIILEPPPHDTTIRPLKPASHDLQHPLEWASHCGLILSRQPQTPLEVTDAIHTRESTTWLNWLKRAAQIQRLLSS